MRGMEAEDPGARALSEVVEQAAEDAEKRARDDVPGLVDAADNADDGENKSQDAEQQAGIRVDIQDGHRDNVNGKNVPAGKRFPFGVFAERRRQIEFFVGPRHVDDGAEHADGGEGNAGNQNCPRQKRVPLRVEQQQENRIEHKYKGSQNSVDKGEESGFFFVFPHGFCEFQISFFCHRIPFPIKAMSVYSSAPNTVSMEPMKMQRSEIL